MRGPSLAHIVAAAAFVLVLCLVADFARRTRERRASAVVRRRADLSAVIMVPA